jgi:N-acetylglucosamine-6-phosphate deacetylase
MSSYVAALGPDGFGTYSVDFSEGTPAFVRVSRAPQTLLIPGLVDLHIHGGFGVDFMNADRKEMSLLCDMLETGGYEGFLPTTVTASAADVRKALNTLPDHRAILGFHLEGPFLSPKHPGAQPPSAIVDPPTLESEWDDILEDPRLRLVTLAPERPHALELTARLMQRGVIVSMGHTDATFEEARRGFEFGASHMTHTFNAMRGFHHREAGAAGYAMVTEGLRVELVYDRLHVCPDAARLLLKCKGQEEVVAVSDGTMATGLPPHQRIQMWGLACVTGRDEVRLEENGALAGSAVTLLEVFRNLSEDFGPETAIRLCCLNPRRALGMGEPKVYVELDHEYRVVARHQVRPHLRVE